MVREAILVMDAGGFKSQRTARMLRDMGVYSEILPLGSPMERINALSPLGFILVGDECPPEGAERQVMELVDRGLPMLAIGGGMQLLCRALGGKTALVERFAGVESIKKTGYCPLFDGIDTGECYFEYEHAVTSLPQGLTAVAASAGCGTAAVYGGRLYGVQFYPDNAGTLYGERLLRRFARKVCGAVGQWNIAEFAATSIEDIRRQVGGGRVLLALSGGVDSAVCAALISKAIGDRLTCIFVDHGLMRKNEPESVRRVFADGFEMNLIMVDAERRFLQKLEGVTDPERKRRIIGEEFIRVFEEEAKKLGQTDYLAQGTIYPDIIESGAGGKGVVKSHHNVGGLPERIEFKALVEPLKYLFKDEVRALGLELKLPKEMVNRQPFPGPGLGVRCIGELKKDRLDVLRDADQIMREEIEKHMEPGEVDQYFAVLTEFRTVGVRDGQRTYGYTVALRAVSTTDYMEAGVARIPYPVLEQIAQRITREVPQVGRVVYDITAKPPGTIEWE